MKKKLTTEEHLDMLFQYKGNIKLFNSIKQFWDLNKIMDEFEPNKDVSKELVKNEFVLTIMKDIVFSVLEAIFLFEDKPHKCLGWTKGILKRYVTNDAIFLKTLILEGLQDKNRFQKETNNLYFIIQEITHYDCSILPDESPIGCGMFEYFTGNNSYSDLNKVMTAFASVRGLLKNNSDIVRDFIKAHHPEIIKQLQYDVLPKDKPTKTFIDYLKHNKPEQLAKKLKAEFSKELQERAKNKNTALFVFGLNENQLLNLGGANRTALHKTIKKYFNIDIGTETKFREHIDHHWKLTTYYSDEDKLEFVKRISNIRINL